MGDVHTGVTVQPQRVTNRNVPKDVLLLADVCMTSGELHDTYYITRDGGLWVVGDWVDHKPRPAYPFQVCRLTGYTYNQIEAMYQDWIAPHAEEESCTAPF